MAGEPQLGRSHSQTVRSQLGQDPIITDGFNLQALGSAEEAPPAYGDHIDQLQLSNAGFEAGAAITGKETSHLGSQFMRARANAIGAKTMDG